MSKRPYTIKLSDTDRQYLQKICRTRTAQAQTVDRSRILLLKEKGRTDKDISQGLGICINTVRMALRQHCLMRPAAGIRLKLRMLQRHG